MLKSVLKVHITLLFAYEVAQEYKIISLVNKHPSTSVVCYLSIISGGKVTLRKL